MNAVRDVDFPADRDKLLKQARQQNADNNVIDTIERLPKDQFGDQSEVRDAVTRIGQQGGQQGSQQGGQTSQQGGQQGGQTSQQGGQQGGQSGQQGGQTSQKGGGSEGKRNA